MSAHPMNDLFLMERRVGDIYDCVLLINKCLYNME